MKKHIIIFYSFFFQHHRTYENSNPEEKTYKYENCHTLMLNLKPISKNLHTLLSNKFRKISGIIQIQKKFQIPHIPQEELESLKKVAFHNFFHKYYAIFLQYLQKNPNNAEQINKFFQVFLYHVPFLIWINQHKSKCHKSQQEIDLFILKMLRENLNYGIISPEAICDFIMNKAAQKHYQHYDFSDKTLLGSKIEGNDIELANIAINYYHPEIFVYPQEFSPQTLSEIERKANNTLKNIVLSFQPIIFYAIPNYKKKEHMIFAKESKEQKKEFFDCNSISLNGFYKKLSIQNGPHCVLFSTFLLCLTKVLGNVENAIKVCIEMNQLYNQGNTESIIILTQMIENIFKFMSLDANTQTLTLQYCNNLKNQAKPLTQKEYCRKKSLSDLIKNAIVKAKITQYMKTTKNDIQFLLKQIKTKKKLFAGIILATNMKNKEIQNIEKKEQKEKTWENFINDLEFLIPRILGIMTLKKKNNNLDLKIYDELTTKSLNNPNLLNDLMTFSATSNARKAHLVLYYFRNNSPIPIDAKLTAQPSYDVAGPNKQISQYLNDGPYIFKEKLNDIMKILALVGHQSFFLKLGKNVLVEHKA